MTVFTEDEVEQMGLKYYNAEVHKSAFVLPQFAKKVIKSICRHCVVIKGQRSPGVACPPNLSRAHLFRLSIKSVVI